MSNENPDKIIPMDAPHSIKFSLFFNEDEYQKIIAGFTPFQMEEKWFVYFEDDWLHIGRSWTGYELFKAQIVQKENWYVIEEFFVERNAEKYKGEDDEDEKYEFAGVIAYFVLKTNSRIFAKEQATRQNEVILEF